MNQKQSLGYGKQWLMSVPDPSQQKEQGTNVRAHENSPNQESAEFTSINKDLRN